MDSQALPRMALVIFVFVSLCPSFAQNNPQADTKQNQTTEEQQPSTQQPEQHQPGVEQPSKKEKTEEPEALPPKSQPLPQDPGRQAWDLLEKAAHSDKASERITSIRALGLLPNNSRALKLAEAALLDEKPEVRSTAASTLGELRFKSSIPKLRSMLEDKEPSVVLAAAHALQNLNDEAAYEVFYEILTGERKASKGLIADQTSILHDPKKLAKLGIEEGISNVVPFGGFGVYAYRMMSKNQGARVRAAAAKELAEDPDPASTKALMNAAGDNDWTVRASAIEGLAKRNDPSALSVVELYMYDDKSEVKYNAAATTLRLMSPQPAKRLRKQSSKNVKN